MEEILYTVKETAKLLKVNPNYVYDLIKKEMLPALKLGSFKIRRTSLLNFVKENEGKDMTDLNNIKELISTAKNNLSDIKVALKNGEVQDLDIDKIDSSEDSEDYKKEILGIVFYIKPNSNNDNKVDNITKFIDEYVNNEKYTVTLEYDSNGLVKTVNAKIQDEN